MTALAADAVTGLVAGMAAGGMAALRADLDHDQRTRAVAVVAVVVFVYVTLRVVPGLALLIAPVLPFTCLGVADHLTERRVVHPKATG